MRYIITGANGFIGNFIARSLAKEGCQILAIYRNRFPENLSGVQNIDLLQGDLRHIEKMSSTYDVLIHCASDQPETCDDAAELYKSNVEGASNIYKHSISAGVRYIIYLSSMAVYGRVSESVISEKTDAAATDSYGLSKLMCEESLKAEVTDGNLHSAISIRMPSIVGYKSHSNFLSNIFSSIRSNKPIKISNPDGLFNNVVHVSDLFSFIQSLCSTFTKGYTVCNIASKEPAYLLDIIKIMYRGVKQREEIEVICSNKKPFTICTEKCVELGFDAPRTLETIRKYVHDYIAVMIN